MGKDVCTPYTKYLNKECGRTGYYRFEEEKAIPGPKEYGMFLLRKKSRKKLSI